MIDNRYDVRTSPGIEAFEFDSVGPRGTVRKVVHYSEINIKNFYNLGFGDKDLLTGFISDLSVTNNNDSKKVLATVAATLYAFTDSHPRATIIAAGSTEARTRLYRIGISNNLIAIEKDFIILGLTATDWEPFRRNITYGAFLVRKNCKFEIMKTKKSETKKPKLPKGFTVDPELTGKYDDQPLFKDKVDRANHILKTVGLPKFEQHN